MAKTPTKTAAKAAPSKSDVVRVGQSQPPVDGKSRVVEAVGSAASHKGKDKRRAIAIETAMGAAVTKAGADGVTDSNKIRDLQLAAGRKAAEQYDADRAAEQAAISKQQAEADAANAKTAAAKVSK